MIEFLRRYELHLLVLVTVVISAVSLAENPPVEHDHEYLYLPIFGVYAALRTKHDLKATHPRTMFNAAVRWGALIVIALLPGIQNLI